METLAIIAIAVVLVLFLAPNFPFLPIAACAYLLGLLLSALRAALAKKPNP